MLFFKRLKMHLIVALLFLVVWIWIQISNARYEARQRKEAIRQSAEEMARRESLWRKAEEAFQKELALSAKLNRAALTLQERLVLTGEYIAASGEARKLAIYRY